jgi:DNA invertase Pin-like site-specific DNA recombinase
VIAAFAEAHGFTILRWFDDPATSGCLDTVDRPGFSAMVGELNGVRDIIIERVDRLARSVAIADQTITWFAAHGINLHAADTGENVTDAYMGDPMRKAMVQVQQVFAELDKNMLVRKLRAAREAKRRRTGRCEGVPEFGQRSGEADAFARIKALRETGLTYREIARALNEEGCPTRNAPSWGHGTVRAICVRHGFRRGQKTPETP